MKMRSRRGAQGFSLIEVLVSVLVVAVGLLGVSKMQAAGVSNSQVARTRSLVAMQASSLAAAMHGNPGYWAQTPPSLVQFSGTSIDDPTGVLATTAGCTTRTCTPGELAADDVHTWAGEMNKRFPKYIASIACKPVADMPMRCLINVGWQEKYIAVNRSTTDAAKAVQTSKQQFSLVVEP